MRELRELEGKLLPFFVVFFFSLCFFLLFEKKKMSRKSAWKKWAKARNEQKWKVEWELEHKLLPFSTFFFLYGFFSLCVCFFFLCLRRKRCQEKTLETKGQKQEGRSKSQKWEGRTRGWRWAPFLLCIFFLFYGFFFFVFFFFSSLWKEEDARKSVWNGKQKQEGKSERAHRKLEGNLPPFSWFFFLLFSCVFCFLYVWEEENDSNVSSFSSMVVFQWRRRWQLFFGGVKV